MSYAQDAAGFKLAQAQNQAQFRNQGGANSWNHYQNAGGAPSQAQQAQAAAAASLMAIRQSHPQPATAPLVRMAPSPEPDGDESEPESRAGDVRAGRKQQGGLKGLFSKDCESFLSNTVPRALTSLNSERNYVWVG